MPFSDDEPIRIEKKSKLKTIVLTLAISLFAVSLFNNAFCSNEECKSSAEALIFGWLALLGGKAAISWLANPFLLAAWLLLTRNKKSAWAFALISVFFCLQFLNFKTLIKNEAGHYMLITTIGIGYWMWLASCIVTFIGCLAIRISKA